MPINGLQVGQFGFFRDPDLTLRLQEENLYDQIDADGWINVWFGGTDVFLPEYGEFSVYITCKTTFFWDIVDSNGLRTKSGFSEMLVPYNPHIEPYFGDLIPENPEEVFPVTTTAKIAICSNLWFYTNLFKDEYYRYNLIVLNKNTSSGWPDEANAKILPMNDSVFLEDGDYIVGYRPKPEYMNQLSVIRKIISGRDNAIHFKLKVDLDYLAENPEAVRKLRIFSMSSDVSEFLVYPNQIDNINWKTHMVPYMDEYNRYLLYHGIQQYAPNEAELHGASQLYSKFMDASNLALKMDPYNKSKVISDIQRILDGEADLKLVGFSYEIIPLFLEWMKENLAEDIPTDTKKILRRIVLTMKYFKGFENINVFFSKTDGLGSETHTYALYDGDNQLIDGDSTIADGGVSVLNANIVMVDGVRMFSDGYMPTSALEYRFPEDGSGYHYSGAIGNGFYKIMIAGVEKEVFCDMENGGWMYLIVSGLDDEYMSQFCDMSSIDSVKYYDNEYGIGWGTNDGIYYSLQFYNLPFSDIKVQLSGDYNNPENGTGYLEMVTGANGSVISFIDGDETGNYGQDVIVDGINVLPDNKTNLTKFNVGYKGDNDGMNTLTVKMRGDSNIPYCRRYVKMLAVK